MTSATKAIVYATHGKAQCAFQFEMAREVMQDAPAKPTRAKRRAVTSCLECYRRKQKCDRTRPCNFCSARGVPGLCRYEKSPHPLGYPHEASGSSKTSHTSNNSESPIDLLDQIGYSPASRRDDLRHFGKYGSGNAVSAIDRDSLVSISITEIYTGLVARLPSESAISKLIDIHFSAETWSFPIVDENHFRELHRQFQRVFIKGVPSGGAINLPLALSTFPALLFSILAVALQFTTPDSDEANEMAMHCLSDVDEISQRYITTGQEIVEVLKEQKPTTTSIQYHLTKMAWLKNSGRGSESWQALGIALRQAQEIDLHQIREDGLQVAGASLGQTLTRLWELEHRKRLWARIFIMDSHMAIALGRPRGIHREDCSTQAPLDCEYPKDPSQTVPVSTKHVYEPPNSFSPIIFSLTLGHKYHDLMSMRASKLDLKDIGKVRSLHQEVQFLLAELPPALRPLFPDTAWDELKPELPAVRLRLLTTANIFLLALHRPYISTHEASRYAAIDAAFEILRSQQRLFGIVHEARYKLYSYSFYTIDAGVLLAGSVVKYPDLDHNIPGRALQELQQAAIRLGLMKERSSIAKTGEVLLRQCCAVLEARTPSPSSGGSLESFLRNDELVTTDIDFLQQFGSHVFDQETRDFLSLLSDSTTFGDFSTPSKPPTQDISDAPQMVTNLPALAPNLSYLDPMSNDQALWQF